jgi:hypothetical protein
MSRRFTFSLRTLLLGTVVVTAALAWWVSWPQRRASKLMDAMVSSPDEAEAMSPQSGMWNVLRKYPHDRPYLEAQSRSFADVMTGRQVFTVVVPTYEKRDGDMLEFTGTLIVTRGALQGPIELDARKRLPDDSRQRR